MVEGITESYSLSGIIISVLMAGLYLFFVYKKENSDSSIERNIGIIINKKVFYNAIYWNIDSNESFEQEEEVEVIETFKGKAKIRKLSENEEK